MTTLPDPILANRGNPERGFRNEFIIVSKSDIEDKIKARGWTGRTPVTTVTLHMDEGDIMNTLHFLSATGRGTGSAPTSCSSRQGELGRD